jgi:hypothetical protein
MADYKMDHEAASKDRFFVEVGNIGEAMIAAHGKEFAMGVLVLAARFIAEGKSLKPTGEAASWPGSRQVSAEAQPVAG